jgi:hypothetical protein
MRGLMKRLSDGLTVTTAVQVPVRHRFAMGQGDRP